LKENEPNSLSLATDLHVAATSKLVEALVQSENKMRLRLDLLSEVVFEIRPSGEIEFLNRAWVAVGGQKVESLRGKPFIVLFVEEDRPKVEALIAEPADIPGGRIMTCRIARPDGRECWVELSAVAVPGTGWVGTMRDVTRSKQALEQLELLSLVADKTDNLVIITDARGLVRWVNRSFAEFTGYTLDEVYGRKPGAMLQGPGTDPEEVRRLGEYIRARKSVTSEILNYTKSGKPYWITIHMTPIFDAHGALESYIAVQSDTTKLHINEERFRLIVKAAGSAVWEHDIDEQSTWFSGGMKEIFGHEPGPGEDASVFYTKHIHPEDAPRVMAATDRMVSESMSMHEQYRFRCADGRWAIVEDRAFAVKDGTGRVVRLMGSMIDISERLHLEQVMRQAQKMEAVGQLTGGLAHDFNNLLTIVMGNAELLSDALGERPQLQRMANMTLNAAERGAEMTNRLLAFSRKQPLQPRTIDVGQLVQGMESLLQRTLAGNIDIEIISAGGLWKADLDAGQLESALLNLAVNARDSMPDGGLLTIETANCTLDAGFPSQELDVKAGQYVMLTVSDTGHGIPKDEIGRVFEPFFTTKDVGKGSGLGLSMVYGFVKQSSGHIQVFSEQGQGTALKLYFPRSVGKEEPEKVNDPSTKIFCGHEVILVVEDDHMVREHVVRQLNSMGYRIIEAATGSEAVEILKQGAEIDLLFTDVVMPGGMSGSALADAVRAMKPGIKVLFTSGYTENALMHDGRLDQGVQLLTKPYRSEQLAFKVREVLSGN